jgi:putative transcriptional regulator
MDFTRFSWKTTRFPGIALVFLYTNEQTGDGVVLIRMAPGRGYPRHRHVGEERVLVLQGGYRDEAGRYQAGDTVVQPPGSVHHPVALEGDEDCILLATALGGIELLEES